MIKRFLPRTFLGRSLLIILTPLILLQAVAFYLFYGRHWDLISRRLAGGVAGELSVITELLRRIPPADADIWVLTETGQRFDLLLRLDRGASLPAGATSRGDIWSLSDEELSDAIAERVRRPFVTDWQGDPRYVLVQIDLGHGVLHVGVPRKRLTTATVTVFVLWVLGSAMLLFGIATLFMRNQVKPIRRLAAAAESFGKGLDVAPLTPQGASEVRQAAAAFNVMRARVQRFLAQRTEMLAGVSHDLRTPLTRLRLALAMLPKDSGAAQQEVAEMTADLEEMERMIEGYLAFARGEGAEAPAPHDLAALLADVAGRLDRNGGGPRLEVSAPGPLMLSVRGDAIRRCITNVIENARRHARGRVAVALRRVPGQSGGSIAELLVDDDGPGIPPDQREAAFRPFTRLVQAGGEAAPGGIGLGLTIARDIARAHGGDVLLEDGALGGLRVRIRLPV